MCKHVTEPGELVIPEMDQESYASHRTERDEVPGYRRQNTKLEARARQESEPPPRLWSDQVQSPMPAVRSKRSGGHVNCLMTK